MNPDTTPASPEGTPLSRRTVLAHGASAAGALVGLDHLTGGARGWHRFDVDFRSSDEVWLIVGDDRRYEPPAVAHVIVARDGKVECDLIECSRTTATTVPAAYGDAPVVPYTTAGTVLGVLPYNRPFWGDGRFSRPRCLLGNDTLPESDGEAACWEADCVRAATDDAWNGSRHECWFDPVDAEVTASIQTTVTPEGRPGGVAFGTAVELDAAGDVAVVGAPAIDGSRGAAYAFERTASGWEQTGRFRPEADVADFGSTVAVDAAGTRLLVGAPAVDEPAVGGSATLFAETEGDWERRATLDGNGDGDAQFGTAVSLDGAGETAVVGVPSDQRGDTRGKVVVFDRVAGWNDIRTLFIPDLEPDLGFGGESPDWGRNCRIAADGDTLLVAAPRIGFSFGEVRVFTRASDGWTHAGRLGRGLDSHGLGHALAITPDGGTSVLGSNVSSPDTPHPEGFALLARETDAPWAAQSTTRVKAEDGAPLDGYGRAVASDRRGERLLIGSPFHDHGPGEDAGVASLVAASTDGITEVAKLVAEDAAAGDNFGDAAALNRAGTRGLIGAPGADGGGAVYVLSAEE